MRIRNFGWTALLFISVAARAADTEPAPAKKKYTLLDLLNATTSYPHKSATVAGVRGLEETAPAVDTKARDYVAVEHLEHVVIHPNELLAFLDEGKLH